MSNDAEVLATVRHILDERRPAEDTIRAIRKLLEPPRERQPVELTGRGWPVLRASEAPSGTAWEYHDDPEMP
ncbi:hypothetical protein [Kribbella sp. NPDC051137]|uniref:hypothetical protein n=1 Tax=Kribbella sp. NPDC051137 TaxID=3155045 RepID=UPI0034185B8D